MTMTRRDFNRAAVILAAGLAQLRAGTALAETAATGAEHMHEMQANWIGTEQITLVVYPGMTALDLVGPQYSFAGLMGATVRMVSKDGAPFTTDTGLTFTPDGTFADSPVAPDILFVGGGAMGTLEAMKDVETLEYLADRGSKAGLVTSVCTGSLLLAAAGLLDGYKATSHWAAREQLAEFGAVPVDSRVVTDRNRITAAGVSAGIDLGLVVAEMRRDELYAQCLQLGMEYAPQPLFNAGTPATAPAEAFQIMDSMYVGFRSSVSEIAKARKT
jgi:cyclohexyl-isocyanide hydratase